jgi:hypothetical protein
MDDPGLTTDLLHDPEVKACFLQLLESPFSDEVKYQKFVEFCARQGVSRAHAHAFLAQALPGAVQEPGVDVAVDELAARAVDSILLAVRRMQRSQHVDGGWGLQIEQSGFWHTAYTLLFLKASQEILGNEMAAEIEEMLRHGGGWLEQHPEVWSPDTLTGVGGMSIYEISLMVLCFYRVGRPLLRREPALRVYRGLDRLYHAQNDDGGWDASVWGYEVSTPARMWSEVGATSMALRAMAETHDERFQIAMVRGIQWLVGTQNPDGSWSEGSCHPALPDFQVEGNFSIEKTCAALHGILAGEELDLPLQPYRGCIEYGLAWLHRLARPVLERRKRISRWGWGYSADDYVNLTAILELLLCLPDGLPGATPAEIAPYVSWFIEIQRRQPDDPEDGCWVLGHTARIGLALAGFYKRVKGVSTSIQVPWIA